nr:putative reverse transcriptase domain-containing protein [Tanacetum cinerariifolium]
MKSVIYTNHESPQHIFDQKELNMCQQKWIELFRDFDSEIRSNPRKANAVADVLSRKERVKPRRVRAMSMTISQVLRTRYWLLQVIVSRLTNSAHFLAMREDYSNERLAKSCIDEIVARHGVSVPIIFDRDGRFTSSFWQTVQKALGTRLDMGTAYHPQTNGQSKRTIQTLKDMLRACVIDFGGNCDVHLPLAEFSYNNNIIRVFDVLHLKHCMEGNLGCPFGRLKLEKVVNLGPSWYKRQPTRVEVGDKVMLEVSSWKDVVHFEKKEMLARRYASEVVSSGFSIVKVRQDLKRGPKFRTRFPLIRDTVTTVP